MATAMRTAFVDRIAGWALAHRIAVRLTGDYDDLRRLLAEMNARPDPSDRGHREKPDYKNLFRFRQKPPEA
jgi:hypothetical protein